MKTISNAFRDTSLGSEVTTLCTCWEITRTDGVVFRFTDLDVPVTVAAVTYAPAIGYNRTAVSNSSDMSVDNMDVEGILDDDSITDVDMRAGKFDYAAIRVFVVDWNNPENGIMRIRRGWLGEVMLTPAGKFRVELRGLNQAYSQQIGESFTPECRADLGDARCKIDIDSNAWARNGEIVAVTDRRTFVASITDPDPRAADLDWYVGGVLSWLSGDNVGRNIEIKSWNGSDTFELFLSAPYAMQVGDTFRIRPGCNKMRLTCIEKFDNIINMRAEPFIPGQDLLATYPDAQ